MPVGVLGQSDFGWNTSILRELTRSHQCLSAFWVSRTYGVGGLGTRRDSHVTNACRRFGSVGPELLLTLLEEIGVVTNACRRFGSVGLGRPRLRGLWVPRVTNACRRFGSVGLKTPKIKMPKAPASPMPVGVLGQSDRSHMAPPGARAGRSPMPVGVLGQSDVGRNQKPTRRKNQVTNACRRFGSVGPGELKRHPASK